MANGVGEDGVGGARGFKLAAADVNHASAVPGGEEQRSGQVNVGTGRERAVGPVAVNGHNQAAAFRGHAAQRSVVLRK